jgi:hypothetical protein
LTGEVAQAAGVEIGGLGALAGLSFNPLLVAAAAVVMILQKPTAQFSLLREQELLVITTAIRFPDAWFLSKRC